MWPRGHMDLIQPVGTGQWVHMSRTGGLIQASRHPQQDGISSSKLKGCNMVRTMAFHRMGLLHHQTVKRVGAGWEATNFIIITTHLMVLGCFWVVRLTFLRVLNGHLLQYRKSELMILNLQRGEVNPICITLFHRFLTLHMHEYVWVLLYFEVNNWFWHCDMGFKVELLWSFPYILYQYFSY